MEEIAEELQIMAAIRKGKADVKQSRCDPARVEEL